MQSQDPWKLVIKNDCPAVQNYLTKENTDVNKKITMENNMTILHVAVSEQKHQIVKMLLSHPSINVEQPDLFGKTALHYAAANGDYEACQMLQQASANSNAQNCAGETPFMKACYFVEKDLLQWMLENVKDLNQSLMDCMNRSAQDVLSSNLNLKYDDIQVNDPQQVGIINTIKTRMLGTEGLDQNKGNLNDMAKGQGDGMMEE